MACHFAWDMLCYLLSDLGNQAELLLREKEILCGHLWLHLEQAGPDLAKAAGEVTAGNK